MIEFDYITLVFDQKLIVEKLQALQYSVEKSREIGKSYIEIIERKAELTYNNGKFRWRRQKEEIPKIAK